MAESNYYPEVGSKEDYDENTPEIVLKDRNNAEKPNVIHLGYDGDDQAGISESHDGDYKAEYIPLSETIHFDELPKSWQKHILKRQEEGYLPKDKLTFTKAEILKAASSEDSFTPSETIGKLFERIDKEKIDFDLLPKIWQEKLQSINKFGNITVDYLKKKGAKDSDIERIKSGYYRQENETARAAGLKEKIVSEFEQSEIDRMAKEKGLPADTASIPSRAQTFNVGGLWNSVKSGWGRLFGKK